jgi:hypothetical protein
MRRMAGKKLRVLFVGNSYTYYNDMPQAAFTELAKAAGYEVEVTAVTHGGYKLCQFADPRDEHGKRLREAIAGKRFDCAVLQEQSLNPIRDEEEFLAGVEGVKALICADKFVLYATWGRNDGSPDLAALGLTRAEMTEKLSAAYNRAGKRYGMKVAEVGKAFLAHPEKDALYDPDMTHPSAVGSEIAARVILEQVIEK